MSRSPRLPLAALFVAILALPACGDDPSPRPDATPAALPEARPPQAGSATCPADGRWSACTLLDRVTKAGIGFRETGDSVVVPGIDVPGVRYRVGRSAELVAFFYADSTALRRDKADGDLANPSIPSATPADSAPPGPPYTFQSANLFVALVGASATQVERLELAITAGPPQPAAAPAPTVLPPVPNARP